jgi:hypothetical protein
MLTARLLSDSDRSEYAFAFFAFFLFALLVANHKTASSASPFWRAPPRDTPPPKKTTRDSSLVVGAAYSHADMLKIDSLYLHPPSTANIPPLTWLQVPFELGLSPNDPAFHNFGTRTERLTELCVAGKEHQVATAQDIHELPFKHQR